MNVLKAQQELLTGIFHGKRCFCLNYDEENVIISVEGYNGYLVPRAHLHVEINKSEMPTHFPKLDVIDENNVLLMTSEHFVGDGKVLIKFDHLDGGEVWINSKLLSNFKKPTLYQAPGDYTNTILVTEDEQFVGFVMPHVKPYKKGAKG